MKYTKVQLDFLLANETTPRKELTKKFNTMFCTNQTVRAVAQRCRKLNLVCPNNGRFKKGSSPANKGTKGLTSSNKTSFKPGSIPLNKKEVGTIVSVKDNKGRAYMRIKIADPNKWQKLHQYIWEQRHGKIPKGFCVVFKDRNTFNMSIDNLMLVSRDELARLNKKYASIDGSLKEVALQVIRVQKEVRNAS